MHAGIWGLNQMCSSRTPWPHPMQSWVWLIRVLSSGKRDYAEVMPECMEFLRKVVVDLFGPSNVLESRLNSIINLNVQYKIKFVLLCFVLTGVYSRIFYSRTF